MLVAGAAHRYWAIHHGQAIKEPRMLHRPIVLVERRLDLCRAYYGNSPSSVKPALSTT